MRRRAAERFTWAVETLAVAPSDRVLEIGCGQGVAVSLICPALSGGTIVGIDRSQAMIEQARRRNRDDVRDGKAAFAAVALGDASFAGDTFDKAFAINVRLFRADAAREADVLRRTLAPQGLLYLFQQHPSERRTHLVTEELATALEGNGFTVHELKHTGAGDSVMTAIVAAPLRKRGRENPPS